MAGADFGGGVWDLLASGPRRAAQRALIEKAIGPIWETNHVWLILVVVLLFGAFPPAFAAVSVALPHGERDLRTRHQKRPRGPLAPRGSLRAR